MTSRLLTLALQQQRQFPALLRNGPGIHLPGTPTHSILPRISLVARPAAAMRHNSTNSTAKNDGSGPGMQYTQSEILINSLKSNPIETAKDALDRIAEARSVPDSKYLVEILGSMRDTAGDTKNGPSSAVPFRTHLLSRHVCQDLLEVIAKTDESANETFVGTRTILDVYEYAKSQGWEIDSVVLADTAILLAKRSLDGYICAAANAHSGTLEYTNTAYIAADRSHESADKNAIAELEPGLILPRDLQIRSRILSKSQARQADAALTTDALDAGMAIVRTMVDRSCILPPGLFSVLARVLCVHKRVVDVEWLFEVSKKYGDRCSDCIYAPLISLYYRVGKAERADKMFDEFQSMWQAKWSQIRSQRVMCDTSSASTEKWRLEHEEHVDSPKVMSAGELKAIREQAADPYYQRALAMVRKGDIDGAVDFVTAAKHREFVAFTPDHFDVLERTIVEKGCLDLGYKLYVEISRGCNSNGGKGVTAEQVIHTQVPRNRTRNRLALAFANAEKWDIAWRLVDHDAKSGSMVAFNNTSGPRALMLVALRQSNMLQAKECADRIHDGMRQHTDIEALISDRWLDKAFALASSIRYQPKAGEMHPVCQLTDWLLYTSERGHGTRAPMWNVRLLRYTFGSAELGNRVRAQAQSGLLEIINRRQLLDVPDIRAVVLSVVNRTLGVSPKAGKDAPIRIDDESAGWKVESSIMESSDSQFWQCALDAIVREAADRPDIHELAFNALSVLKAMRSKKAKVPPSSLSAVEQLVAKAGKSVVDSRKGGLILAAEQASKALAHMKHGDATASQTTDQHQKVKWRIRSRSSSATPNVKNNSPIKDKLEWYRSCRRNFEVPDAKYLTRLISDLAERGRRDEWEPIVKEHMPEYMEAMANTESVKARDRTKFAVSVWESAMVSYVQIGDIEEAVRYFQMIVDMGKFATPFACAKLLLALKSSEAPLPVLNARWSSSEKSIYGLEPMLPPSGQSPADLLLVSTDQAEHNEQLAQIGLYMLYGCFRSHRHASNFFYNVLFGVLGKARMMSQIRHIFEGVIPAAIRSMPPADRLNPALLPTPLTWGYVIAVAMECSERTLAEYWFKEYRMSAMPIFREEGSSYSRIINQNIPPYARLFNLANPYYIIPAIWRPLDKNRQEQDPAYDLAEVEQQLEMDRLRALDKLPLPFKGVRKMLAIYTCVDEHRNLEAAESLASEIIALSEDRALPRNLRKITSVDFAQCWRHMVKGYLGELQYQQAMPSPDYVASRALAERMVHWFDEWKKAYALALEGNLTTMTKNSIALTGDERAIISACAQRSDR